MRAITAQRSTMTAPPGFSHHQQRHIVALTAHHRHESRSQLPRALPPSPPTSCLPPTASLPANRPSHIPRTPPLQSKPQAQFQISSSLTSAAASTSSSSLSTAASAEASRVASTLNAKVGNPPALPTGSQITVPAAPGGTANATTTAAFPATATAMGTAAAALLTFPSVAGASEAEQVEQPRQQQQYQEEGQQQGSQERVMAETAVVAAAERSGDVGSGGADGGGWAAAPPGSGRPVFCEADTLGGLLRQFVMRQEGFDSGLQLDGLLAYYRRLGCSPEQLQAAVETITAPLPGPGDLGPLSTTPGGGDGGVGALRLPYLRNAAALVEADAGGTAGMGLPGSGAWGASQLQIAASELLAAGAAAAALAAYQSRPRGWSRGDLLEVRSSSISGRGVFARTAIPPRTLLGAYPGRLRSPADMLDKVQRTPQAASYVFRTADGRFLDPTDTSGAPSPYPGPGWPWPLPQDTTLAFVNEPPKHAPGTNTTVEDGPSSDILHFVAVTHIPVGGELLIDYGVSYDRSGYGIRRGGGE